MTADLDAAHTAEGQRECHHADGCDKPAVWRVRYLACRIHNCDGHLACDEHIGREPLEHVVRLEDR